MSGATMPIGPSTRGGLSTLSGDALVVRGMLEEMFLHWAKNSGASPVLFPPLLPVERLASLDYFENFPHLAVVATGIRPDVLDAEYARSKPISAIPTEHLGASLYVLPSAACYGVYLALDDTIHSAPVYITTVSTCFRNETEYVDLKRLWGFTMREIVCLADDTTTRTHLANYRRRILAFASIIGLPLEVKPATDPFYDRKHSRAKMQELFPVKEEFIYKGELAIGSLNFHRNFFGERCNIRQANGTAAYSSCVAFGVERWIYAFLETFNHDLSAIAGAMRQGIVDAEQ